MASVSGSGADGSLTYAVAMVGNSMFDEIPLPSITVSDATGFISVMIANTVYAATSMSLGDSFAAAIGYTDDGIWRYMELTITGYDAYGENVGAVSQDLGRNSKEYGVVVLEDWVEVDLSELVGATTLVFSLDSNEAGDFGPNYPFYFALDNLVYTTNDPVTTPEPATMAIFGLGILGVTAFRRRSRKDV